MEIYSSSYLSLLRKKYKTALSLLIAVDVVVLVAIGVSFFFLSDSTFSLITTLDCIAFVIFSWISIFISTSYLLKQKIYIDHISSLLGLNPIYIKGEVIYFRPIARIKHIDTNLIRIKDKDKEKEVYAINEFKINVGDSLILEVRDNFVTSIKREKDNE